MGRLHCLPYRIGGTIDGELLRLRKGPTAATKLDLQSEGWCHKEPHVKKQSLQLKLYVYVHRRGLTCPVDV